MRTTDDKRLIIQENIDLGKKRDRDIGVDWYQDHTLDIDPKIIDFCKTDLSREELINSPLASSIAGIAEGVFGAMYAKIKKELREEMMPKGIAKLKLDVDNFSLLEEK